MQAQTSIYLGDTKVGVVSEELHYDGSRTYDAYVLTEDERGHLVFAGFQWPGAALTAIANKLGVDRALLTRQATS
ncbi:MAG: hypothetical protein M3P51_04280 [Chloroflexota bacterium]|nr:hypothetical protein [Chloroflexota bacterium]